MRRVVFLAIAAALAAVFTSPRARAQEKKIEVSAERIKAIEAAAPERPIAEPAKPRSRLLVYGRVPTHPESVTHCFKAMEILGRKSGAFEAVCSGDPAMFLPEKLKDFAAVLMNNTHESNPLLPAEMKQLSPQEQKAAKDREEVLKKSFLDFVAGGKGLVGIHGATCSVKWPEYMEMIGGTYAGHITERVWIKPERPDHPLCAPLAGKSFDVHDEIYLFGGPYSRQKVRVLLSLDLERTKDPGKRPDKDYAVSWVRRYGKGRVFYCSLGHEGAVYTHPIVMRHYLAGIQFALGDLAAEPALPAKPGE